MLRLSKIRAAAIESSTKIVVLDGEEFKSGWTMLSPVGFNVRISDQFEEKILLVVSDRRLAAACNMKGGTDFQGDLYHRA